MSRALPRVFVTGHRGVGCSIAGGGSAVPENSMAAFEKAVSLGLTAVELDVWLTLDNKLLVIHGIGEEGFLYDTVVNTGGASYPVCAHDSSTVENCCCSCNLRSNSASQSQNLASLEPGGPNILVPPPVPPPLRIETLNYADIQSRGGLRLRRPWLSHHSCPSTTDESNAPKINLSNLPTSALGSNTYHKPKECACMITADGVETPIVVSNSNSKQKASSRCQLVQGYRADEDYVDCEQAPLLSDVMERFRGRLRINVELKGNNPKIGFEVLKLAREYPGMVYIISSFCWRAPNEKEGSVVDLLQPIVGNESKIPLALLFDCDKPMSLEMILECLRRYQCDWAHIPDNYALLLSSGYLERCPQRRSLDAADASTVSTVSPGLYSSDGSAHGVSDFTAREKNGSFEKLELPRAASLVNSAEALRNFTDALHAKGYKVLVYSNDVQHEPKEAIEAVVSAGVDAYCVNDVEAALEKVELSSCLAIGV